MARSADRAREVAGRLGFSWRTAGITLVAMLALVGAGLLGAALNAPSAQPPQPVAEAAPVDLDPADVTTSTPDLTPAPVAAAAQLPRSEPTQVNISKIGVGAKIMPVGLNGDGTLQVPSLSQAQLAGWYRLGPSPGEIGNAVIVGHVDSKEIGPAVFFQLGALLPGDSIQVTRQDGRIAAFTVDGVKAYPKTAFPSELVYGPTDQASLRLVTCGGQFDERVGAYPDNIIVFATLAR